MSDKLEIVKVIGVTSVADGSAIVVKAEVLVADQPQEVEVAITTDLAARAAVAVLATTARARALRDGPQPALEVLAAAVVAASCEEKVRLELLFNEGVTLPVELAFDAAKCLARDLGDDLNSASADRRCQVIGRRTNSAESTPSLPAAAPQTSGQASNRPAERVLLRPFIDARSPTV